MKIKVNYRLLLFSGLLLVSEVACVLGNNIKRIPTSLSPTLHPTATLSSNITLSPVMVASTLIADKDYNTGCPSYADSPSQPDQLGYRGIYPGQTMDQVLEAFGMPMDKTKIMGMDIWSYDKVGIHFIDDKIKIMYVEGDEALLVSVNGIVQNYGCPNLIYINDSKEEPTGDYDVTTFVYYDLGVEFLFYKYPLSTTDIPSSATFFVITTLKNYMESSGWAENHPDAGRLVPWAETVK